jgi:hypothetical protein
MRRKAVLVHVVGGVFAHQHFSPVVVLLLSWWWLLNESIIGEEAASFKMLLGPITKELVAGIAAMIPY